MVGVRALGILCNDPQRGQLALHEASSLVGLPEGADALGVASIVDAAALLSRLPSIPSTTDAPSLADSVGAIKGRCAVVQVRVRTELRPNGPDGHANLGPWRARSYAAAVVGGPQDPDGASASRERLLGGVPDFLRRFLAGQSEGEAFFVAILARVHQRGLLDSPQANATALAEAARELVDKHGPSPRHVAITNGIELIHVAAGMPSAILTLNGIGEDTANRVDASFADSSMARERLRRFRGVLTLGALDLPLKANAQAPKGATLQVLPEGAAVVVNRDLTAKIL